MHYSSTGCHVWRTLKKSNYLYSQSHIGRLLKQPSRLIFNLAVSTRAVDSRRLESEKFSESQSPYAELTVNASPSWEPDPSPAMGGLDSGHEHGPTSLTPGFGLGDAAGLQAHAHRAAARGPGARALSLAWLLPPPRRCFPPEVPRSCCGRASAGSGAPGLQLSCKSGGGARALMGPGAQNEAVGQAAGQCKAGL